MNNVCMQFDLRLWSSFGGIAPESIYVGYLFFYFKPEYCRRYRLYVENTRISVSFSELKRFLSLLRIFQNTCFYVFWSPQPTFPACETFLLQYVFRSMIIFCKAKEMSYHQLISMPFTIYMQIIPTLIIFIIPIN
jgi:hypothetical protein